MYIFVMKLGKITINEGNHQNIAFDTKSVHFERNYLFRLLLLLMMMVL